MFNMLILLDLGKIKRYEEIYGFTAQEKISHEGSKTQMNGLVLLGVYHPAYPVHPCQIKGFKIRTCIYRDMQDGQDRNTICRSLKLCCFYDLGNCALNDCSFCLAYRLDN